MLSSMPPTPPGGVRHWEETPPGVVPAPTTLFVRATHQPRRMEAWALVLVARGLHPIVSQRDALYELHVPSAEGNIALRELAAADAEEHASLRARRVEAQRAVPRAQSYAWLGGALISVGLLVFYGITGPRRAGAPWFAHGASDAALVLQGELHRTVTALTLHADGAHVASNVGIGALVVGAVMRRTGVGFGALLVLLAGALGNLCNALVHASHHSSVGFSTAVFGAIGLLGALAYADARRHTLRRRPAWTALATSVALLAALGASEKSDVLAHLFGALAGTGLGLLVGFAQTHAPRARWQWLFGLGALSAVMLAWLSAFR